ncbi:MAG: GyrI-like domain-containing protein [Oscillospiraceae bacterium]|nr:GyrI-like domain-containing protein [Oscillospiraceae bacterium]
MSTPAIVTYQIHQDEFSFLGIENIVTESSDFGYFWDNFFKMGGYDKINPYATDPKPINVWYTNNAGEKIYFQGLMVINNVDKIPDGYTLAQFPASDFLVVTYEWVPSQDFQMMYEINGGWKYIETIQIPDGYVRYDVVGSPITVIEKENTDTIDGSRYEFWVPIKKS